MRNIKFILIAFILSLTYMRCKSVKIDTTNDQKIKQGLEGKVIWREGNFMPSMDDSNQNKSVGISREILIYELTNINQAVRESEFFKEVKTKLVKGVTSNPDGTFHVHLEPGKYSVFVKEEEGLFANVYDADNNIFPVIIEPSKTTKVSIIVDYKAAY